MDRPDRSRQLASPPLGWMPGDSLETGQIRRQRRAAAEERRFVQPALRVTTSPHERWRMNVRGLVQGVGYRVGCRQKAIDLGLSGWVRNRPDGSVELEAEGLPDRLVELRLWCEKGPQGAQVSGVSSGQVAVAGTDWFEIRT